MPSVFLPIINPHNEALTLLTLIRNDARQRHPRLEWSECLAEAALDRARDMAKRRYFGHTDPDGHAPNDVVRAHGCPIPANYPAGGNSLESIEGGSYDAYAAFDVLARSPGHANHLFGLLPFFAEQDSIGIAFVDDTESVFKWYFVILIARLEGV